jgi:hypothetical protein
MRAWCVRLHKNGGYDLFGPTCSDTSAAAYMVRSNRGHCSYIANPGGLRSAILIRSFNSAAALWVKVLRQARQTCAYSCNCFRIMVQSRRTVASIGPTSTLCEYFM